MNSMKLAEFKSLELIPIKSLLSKNEEERFKFFVPAYQRGYRWTATHVEQLIDDLFEFLNLHSKDDSAFYCMQPLVVKSRIIDKDLMLEVIDGQQRLTTILIILQALRQLLYEDDYAGEDVPIFSNLRNDRFDIKYETRCNSSNWLKLLPQVTHNNDIYNDFELQSCDYSHFAEVYKAAYNKLVDCEWRKFSDILTERTYFIWYYPEDKDGTNADIFDRLNAGKITLNNAELIKALMLQRSNITHDKDNPVLRSVAIEWDNIERRLNDNEFWGFIYSANHPFLYDSHIEYLFDLFAKKTKEKQDDITFTFSCYLDSYRAMMNEGGDKDASKRLTWVEKKWNELKELFDTLNEWYADRQLYHRIGFILEYCEGNTLITLSADLKGRNRDDRIKHLDDIISKKVAGIKSERLFYKSNQLSMILFLYNILLEDRRFNKTARFSFADYKNVRKDIGWDQEHIASHIDYSVKAKDRMMLAKDLIEFLTGYSVAETTETTNEEKERIVYSMPEKLCKDELSTEEQELCESWLRVLNDYNNELNEDRLHSIYDATLTYYQGGNQPFGKFQIGISEKDAKDFIWNFVLLNSKTNRSYGNNIFPIKRKRILNDEFCVYTPVGTRNVFEKAYSKKISQMTSWSISDAKAYWNDIKRVVSKYVILNDLN